MKLHASKFGLAWAIFYALFMLVFMAGAAVSGRDEKLFELYASFIPWLAPTFLGVVIAAAWGAIIGFVFGGGVAWVYNRLLD